MRPQARKQPNEAVVVLNDFIMIVGHAHRHGKQVFYVAADQRISRMLSDLLEHIAEPHSEAD